MKQMKILSLIKVCLDSEHKLVRNLQCWVWFHARLNLLISQLLVLMISQDLSINTSSIKENPLQVPKKLKDQTNLCTICCNLQRK